MQTAGGSWTSDLYSERGRDMPAPAPPGPYPNEMSAGVDREAAQHLGVQVIHALSLPGKVAPATAGAAIKLTIYHILRERGF